ncbi:hypothetical protein CP061683_0498A, partial [Chlamydia psittaci 06-1683]
MKHGACPTKQASVFCNICKAFFPSFP